MEGKESHNRDHRASTDTSTDVQSTYTAFYSDIGSPRGSERESDVDLTSTAHDKSGVKHAVKHAVKHCVDAASAAFHNIRLEPRAKGSGAGSIESWLRSSVGSNVGDQFAGDEQKEDVNPRPIRIFRSTSLRRDKSNISIGPLADKFNEPKEEFCIKRNKKRNQKTKENIKTDESPQRPPRKTWPNSYVVISLQFCYVAGMSNMVEFPNETLHHAGVVYFIPYFFTMLLFGFPSICLEVAICQFTSSFVTSCWKFARICQGLGYAMLISTMVHNVAYTMQMAYVFEYFVWSWNSYLPWTHCTEEGNPDLPQAWNTQQCRELYKANVTLHDESIEEAYEHLAGSEFLHRGVLGTNIGATRRARNLYPWLDHTLLGYQFVGVVMVASINSFSIERYGTLPHLMIVFMTMQAWVLFGRGATLTGASKGLYKLMTPKWEELGTLDLWFTAATRTFNGLGVFGGSHAFIASHCKFKHNFVLSSFIVTLWNAIVNVFFALIVFFYHGSFASAMGVDVTLLTGHATGFELTFVEIPMVLGEQSSSTAWCVLYFGFLYCLALTSQVITVRTISEAIKDRYWQYRWSKYSSFIVSLAIFFASVPMCTDGGLYIFNTLSNNCCASNLAIVAFCTIIAVSYIYGVSRFLRDVISMYGYRLLLRPIGAKCWRIYLKFFLPATLLAGIILNMVQPTVYEEGFPEYLKVGGYLVRAMVLAPIVVVPLGLLVRGQQDGEGDEGEKEKKQQQHTMDASSIGDWFDSKAAGRNLSARLSSKISGALRAAEDRGHKLRDGRMIRERLRQLVTPTSDWGPLRQADRAKWLQDRLEGEGKKHSAATSRSSPSAVASSPRTPVSAVSEARWSAETT